MKTPIEIIKEFIESNIPSEVIDGVCGRVGRFRQHYLQQNWIGEDAIKVVEEATGKPNSISIQYRYDRKGRHPLNEGVIGTRSLNYFVKDWLNPYISEYGYDRKHKGDPITEAEPVTLGPLPEEQLVGVPVVEEDIYRTKYAEIFETCTSEELLNLVLLRIKRIKEETNPRIISENRKTIKLIFDEIDKRVEAYSREGDQY